MTVLLPPAGRLTARPACCTAGSAASTSHTWLTCPASTCCHTAPLPKWKEPRRDRAGAFQPSRRAVARQRAAWEFERRQGIVVDELIAAATAIGEAHPDETLALRQPTAGIRVDRLIGGGRLRRVAYTGRFGPTVLPVLCKLHQGPVSSTPSRTPSPRGPADRHCAR